MFVIYIAWFQPFAKVFTCFIHAHIPYRWREALVRFIFRLCDLWLWRFYVWWHFIFYWGLNRVDWRRRRTFCIVWNVKFHKIAIWSMITLYIDENFRKFFLLVFIWISIVIALTDVVWFFDFYSLAPSSVMAWKSKLGKSLRKNFVFIDIPAPSKWGNKQLKTSGGQISY